MMAPATVHPARAATLTTAGRDLLRASSSGASTASETSAMVAPWTTQKPGCVSASTNDPPVNAMITHRTPTVTIAVMMAVTAASASRFIQQLGA